MLDMHIRPSELMGITDTYLAFCFDEACSYIVKRIQDGDEPILKKDVSKEGNKNISKPSDLYSKFSK